MEGNIYNVNEKGIIPRAVEALFEGVCEADENLEFTFKVIISFLPCQQLLVIYLHMMILGFLCRDIFRKDS